MGPVESVFRRAAKRIAKQGHGQWAVECKTCFESNPIMAADAIWHESERKWVGSYRDVSDLWLGMTGYIDNGREGDHMVWVDESITKRDAVALLKACASVARMMGA